MSMIKTYLYTYLNVALAIQLILLIVFFSLPICQNREAYKILRQYHDVCRQVKNESELYDSFKLHYSIWQLYMLQYVPISERTVVIKYKVHTAILFYEAFSVNFVADHAVVSDIGWYCNVF